MFGKPFRVIAVSIIAICTCATVFADDLTKMIQKDLIALGYDPGNIQGELSTETVVAISQFQAESKIEITGKPSPQLAGIIKARIKQGSSPGTMQTAQSPAAAMDPAAQQQAQQTCLQEKMAAAQASQKKKRGLGSLVRAVANTASRFGGNDTARMVSETSRDIYDVNATAADYERAAKDLGLTTDDIEQCRNPSTMGMTQ